MATNKFIAEYDLVIPKGTDSVLVRVPEEEKKRTLFFLGLSRKNDMIIDTDMKQVILCDKDGNFYEASVHEFSDTMKIVRIRSGEEPERYRSGNAVVHNMRGR